MSIVPISILIMLGIIVKFLCMVQHEGNFKGGLKENFKRNFLSWGANNREKQKVLIYQCDKLRNGRHPMKEALKNITQGQMLDSRSESNWYIPCDYSTSEAQLDDVDQEKCWHWVGLLRNVWMISSKRFLSKTIVQGLGEKRALEIMPRTWSLPRDRRSFECSYQKKMQKKTYVLKKDVHQQKGILITDNPLPHIGSKSENNVNEKNKGSHKEWVQIQEWLEDCFLYQGRRTNFRIWAVIINHDLEVGTFVYTGLNGEGDGILSYAAEVETNSAADAFSRGVASFYSSKSLYDRGYPVTIQQAYKQRVFQKLKGGWSSAWTSILNIIKDLSRCVNKEFINHQRSDRIHYQTFGYDFLLDREGCPRLIEVNMGPGMESHHTSDHKIRRDFHHELVKLLRDGIDKDKSDKRHFSRVD